MASSSAVLMPGCTAAAAACSAAAVTRPASRMRASSDGVLTSIDHSRLRRMPPPGLPSKLPRLGRTVLGCGGLYSADEPPQGAHRPVGDLLDRAGGIDAEEGPLIGVEGDQRPGLLL